MAVVRFMPPEDQETQNNNNGQAQIRKDPNHDAQPDVSANTKKLRYPVAVFLIFLTEFCERFSYYGMRAVLTLYLRNVLNFSENFATTVYHVFLLLCYALPVFGGILADNWLGKFYTIFYISIVFLIGNITLTVSSIPPLGLPIVPLTLLGLLLIAIGTGGIKPCVLALGGEQFKLPEQAKQLGHFFAIFAFIVNAGSLISTTITPMFRRDVACFGDETCYPLAFGVPGSLMIVSLIIFISGKRLYKLVPAEGNILVQVVKCISYAAGKRIKREPSVDGKKSHWLDYAKNKFDSKLINDTKGITRILIYYLPIPMFWALYEQLGSRWTFQATRMNGVVGSVTIKPDQMMVANSILMFTLIPVSETIVYPIFRKCGLLKRPLQRMSVGGIFAAVSFVLAGILEMHIENSAISHIPSFGEARVNIINTLPCPIVLHDNTIENHSASANAANNADFRGILQDPNLHQEHDNLIIAADEYHILPAMDSGSSLNFSVQMANTSNSSRCNMNTVLTIGSLTTSLHLSDVRTDKVQDGGIFRTSIVSIQNGTIALTNLPRAEDLAKSKEGNAKIRFVVLLDLFGSSHRRKIVHDKSSVQDVSIRLATSSGAGKTFPLSLTASDGDVLTSATVEIDPDIYKVSLNIPKSEKSYPQVLESIDIRNGGSYMLVLTSRASGGVTITNSTGTQVDPTNASSESLFKSQLIVLTPPNQVHMAWLLPQYVVMACAEILFIISGSEFSFTEAPESMKSVMGSIWHLTNAVGNLMVIFSAQFDVNEATSFFTFAAMMLLDTIVFALMVRNYKYVSAEPEPIPEKEGADKPGIDSGKFNEVEETAF